MRRTGARPPGLRATGLRTLAAALTALAGLLIAAPAAAQTTDTVFVELRADGAHVRQSLEPDSGAVRVFAIRFDEQTVSLTGASRGGEPLAGVEIAPTPEGRAYRIAVASAAPVVINYTVRGRLDRIPLFVAGGRAEQTVVHEAAEPWLIRLEGDPAALDGLDLSTSLPRFTRAGEGVVTATLSSVPGLLRLSRGGALSFARVADLVVLALLLTAAIWTWRNARVRREGSGAGR
ncbi:hypothetical protein [Candidatus Palauibacter sp.]|uniref:hypothetical protein n=1 Tax=Candidatus Palauibacter sp. TaxID=3101350 RepID=UPI003B01B878